MTTRGIDKLAPRVRRLWPRLSHSVVATILLFLLVVSSLFATTALARRDPSSLPSRVPSSVQILPAAAPTAGDLVVDVGLHIRNIYDLSLVDQSFLAEGWYWYQWGPEMQKRFEQFDVNPDDLLELANEIEPGQYSVRDATISHQSTLKQGNSGRVVRFSAKFYLDQVPQRYAPFDSQRLTIALEVKPEMFSVKPTQVILRPENPPADIVGEDLEISGYQLDSVGWTRNQLVYPDSFPSGMRFSRVTAVFEYGRDEWSMFIKWVFPVLIVMVIVIISPSIEGVLGDIRLAIPPSALLTLVVMQDTYKSSFPPAPYLTYLDEIYVYSYTVCLAIFVLFLVGTNRVSRAADGEREWVMRRVNRVDSLVQASLVIGFCLVAVVGWFT